VGVFRVKFPAVAAAGWPREALIDLAREVIASVGEGRGGAIYLYRLANRQRPLTEEEQRRAYVSGEYAGWIEH